MYLIGGLDNINLMLDKKAKISIVTPCFNEEENISNLYKKIKEIMINLDYAYEHIVIDNCSTDKTVEILTNLAKNDLNLKVILNAKNYGHIRSPYYGLLQASGDCAILMASDFQDPPELITEFINKWELGSKAVLGIKNKSKENFIMFGIRKLYYRLISSISTSTQISNFTGFGLYDRKIVDQLKTLKEPYPYLRGIISEIAYDIELIKFTQPKRQAGKSSNNFFTLYDMAILGFISYSKVPLRLAVFFGFIIALISFLIAITYLILKIIYWDVFEFGLAPLVIGLFFFGAIQLFFIGIIGEYIAEIFVRVKNRPLVNERERINF